MITIDHSHTMVLLIGASHFPDDAGITPIPNVEANIARLQGVLADPTYVGIPATNIVVSLNEDRRTIEKKLRDMADRTRHKKFTLLVYYSGHGILSAEDYKLYLTTYCTSRKDLEIDGINIEQFKNYIRKSVAGRKIVIMDCCHSGAIIGAMNDYTSTIRASLKGFEGTYVMTSAAEDTPSLFPAESATLPTYFTGKLLDIVQEGLDTEQEYCSLRDIFNKIDVDFRDTQLPRPQQSNSNNADELYFSKNLKYKERKPADELAWEEAIHRNSKWAYMDFKRQFPDSPYAPTAKQRIYEIEEEECWKKAIQVKTLSSLDQYLDQYPTGKYVVEAHQLIAAMRAKEQPPQETSPVPQPPEPTPAVIEEPVLEVKQVPTMEKEPMPSPGVGELDPLVPSEERDFDKYYQNAWLNEDRSRKLHKLIFILTVLVSLILIAYFVFKDDNREAAATNITKDSTDAFKDSTGALKDSTDHFMGAALLTKSLPLGTTRLYYPERIGNRRAAFMVNFINKNQQRDAFLKSLLIDTTYLLMDELRDTVFIGYMINHKTELSQKMLASMNRLGKLLSDSLFPYTHVKIKAGNYAWKTVFAVIDFPPTESVAKKWEEDALFQRDGMSFSTFADKTLKYPDTAINTGVSGTVVVQFIVNKKGYLSNVQAISGPPLLRDEAERLIVSTASYWSPARHNGRPVAVLLKQPLAFRLVED